MAPNDAAAIEDAETQASAEEFFADRAAEFAEAAREYQMEVCE